MGPIMSSSSSSSLFSAASKPRFRLPSSAILKEQRNLTGQSQTNAFEVCASADRCSLGKFVYL